MEYEDVKRNYFLTFQPGVPSQKVTISINKTTSKCVEKHSFGSMWCVCKRHALNSGVVGLLFSQHSLKTLSLNYLCCLYFVSAVGGRTPKYVTCTVPVQYTHNGTVRLFRDHYVIITR